MSAIPQFIWLLIAIVIVIIIVILLLKLVFSVLLVAGYDFPTLVMQNWFMIKAV